MVLAVSACSANTAASMPGTRAVQSSSTRGIRSPSPTRSMWTVAVVSTNANPADKRAIYDELGVTSRTTRMEECRSARVAVYPGFVSGGDTNPEYTRPWQAGLVAA
jgi:hypothetical protein